MSCLAVGGFVSTELSEFNRLLEVAQTLFPRVREATADRERNELLDELDIVMDGLDHERAGLQEHIDEVVRAVQGLEVRGR